MATDRGTLFKPELVSDLINKVKGESAIAKLSAQTPIPFNGTEEFTFNFDKEIDIVAEGGKKSEGGISLAPVVIQPIKVEYGARVTDEFMYASEEAQLAILQNFNEGFAKKVAKGLDLMTLHGVNPRTGQASSVIGENHFEAKVAESVEYNDTDPEETIEKLIELIRGKGERVTGIIMDLGVSGALARLKVNGVRQYPELAWGAEPASLNGTSIAITNNLDTANMNILAGNFTEGFRWGYTKQIPLEIIQYGDPDNSGFDLKGYNQIYLRSELYLGWGVLDADSFAKATPKKTASK